MKKIMFFAAFAALLSLASCQEQITLASGTEDNIVSTVKSPVFTATIKPGATKTTLDLSDGKLAWETTDEITVTDAAKKSAVYSIQSIDETSGKATFVIKTGEAALGDGPYTAKYGTEPATAQAYSATAGKLYMTAPATSTNSFEFTVRCGLMKLNLTKSGESVKSIAVTGTPTGGSGTTYTLTCTEAQSIATAKDFCIALPAGSYTKIEITNASDNKCTLNSASGVTVAANHIKPVTFDGSKLIFDEDLPDIVLTANEDPDNEGKYYTMFYDSQCAYTLPQGVKAYTATIKNKGGEQVVMLNNIEGNILPKGEGVLLYSDVSGEMTLTPTNEDADNVEGNVFHGVDVQTAQEEYGYDQYYTLAYGQNGLRFYKMNASMPLSAHKAFLPMSAGAQVRDMRMEFADADTQDKYYTCDMEIRFLAGILPNLQP